MSTQEHVGLPELAPITVLVGHAGVGKTNIAIGMALHASEEGHDVALADLDVVNPYFRSSDYPELLASSGVRLIAPVLARSTLDTPSLTGEIDAVIGQVTQDPEHKRLILDVGGDDDGATTIGRWAGMLGEAHARVLYVVSAYRALTQDPASAAAMLPDIEEHAHLRASAVLNASNLSDDTDASHVVHGREFAHEVAQITGLPLAATVVPWVVAERIAREAGEDLGHERVMSAPQCVALALTDGSCKGEALVLMPRFVRMPWDSVL
mgnify:CR=1 FL=1